MYAYEGAFTKEESYEWLLKQLNRYKSHGFGLWGVYLNDTNDMIGQCGLTLQGYKGADVLEIGYLFNKNFWGQGFAIEAARLCKNIAFDDFGATEVYSIIKDTNIPSQNVAIKNGMRGKDTIVKYYKEAYMPHLVVSIKK